jgi:Spy/CpxP family protein refolding chaperone
MSCKFRPSSMPLAIASAACVIVTSYGSAQGPVPAPTPVAGAHVEVVVGTDGAPDGAAIVPQIVEIAESPGSTRVLTFARPVGGDDWQHMLAAEQVQKELELVEEQRTKLRQLAEEHQAQTQRVFSELRRPRDGDNPPRPDDIGKRLREIETAQRQKVEEILLPHQRKRIQEIALRTRLKQRGTVGTLGDKELAKQLEITDEQQERLRKRAQDVQAELEKKIARLREEARDEIFEELTTSQRQKLKEMLGAEFDYRPEPFGPRTKIAPRVRAAEEPRQ